MTISDSLIAMIRKYIWKLYSALITFTKPYIRPYLSGDGNGFFFGTRNKKEFFLSLLSSFQSAAAVTLDADEIRAKIDSGEIDDTFRFLFPLGKEYWLRPVSTGTDYFMKSVNRWIETNPPASNSWHDSETVAIRAINWIAGYHLFCGHPSITDRFHRRFLRTIYLHGSRLSHFKPDKMKSVLASLTVSTAGQLTGTMFFNHRSGKRWYNRSVRHIDNLITTTHSIPDEESFLSQLECYTISHIASQKLNIPRRLDARAKLLDMFKAAGEMINTPKMRRRIFRHKIEDETPVQGGLLTAGAILFNDSGLKKKYPHLSEDALWLLGAEGFELFRNI